MRAVIQRVRYGRVTVAGQRVGEIGHGLLVLIGVGQGDGESDAQYLADKTVNLRVFEDTEGKMNRSVREVGGEVLVVSQFTLYGDCRKGRRPSFSAAAPPESGKRWFNRYVQLLREAGVPTATGEFGAMMDVEFLNDGPVTLLLDSEKTF